VRRFLGGVAIVVVSLAGVVAVILFLQSRDEGSVSASSGPGEKVKPLCPDKPTGITHDARPLSEDQVRHALELGNVVLHYHGSRPPAALRQIQDELTGPFDAEIAAAGQAVILAGGGNTIEALAWGRRLRARTPGDTALRTFAEAWLGAGAPRPCR
jgi:hypothetical protein